MAVPPVDIVAVPRMVEPSRNVIVPVGVPLPELMVAVSATAAPSAAGFGEAARIIAVAAAAGGVELPEGDPAPPQPPSNSAEVTNSAAKSDRRRIIEDLEVQCCVQK